MVLVSEQIQVEITQNVDHNMSERTFDKFIKSSKTVTNSPSYTDIDIYDDDSPVLF